MIDDLTPEPSELGRDDLTPLRMGRSHDRNRSCSVLKNSRERLPDGRPPSESIPQSLIHRGSHLIIERQLKLGARSLEPTHRVFLDRDRAIPIHDVIELCLSAIIRCIPLHYPRVVTHQPVQDLVEIPPKRGLAMQELE
jgi:hypothetical protein